jgi:tetratricopeptide (TPR) repeat protein
LTIDPRAVEIRFQLGRAIALLGRHPEAAAVFREVLAAEPGYGPAWLELGRSLEHTDRVAAIAAFESAIAYMPTSAEARDALARLRGSAASHPPPTPGTPIR